jgi:hypothetical protein
MGDSGHGMQGAMRPDPEIGGETTHASARFVQLICGLIPGLIWHEFFKDLCFDEFQSSIGANWWNSCPFLRFPGEIPERLRKI